MPCTLHNSNQRRQHTTHNTLFSIQHNTPHNAPHSTPHTMVYNKLHNTPQRNTQHTISATLHDTPTSPLDTSEHMLLLDTSNKNTPVYKVDNLGNPLSVDTLNVQTDSSGNPCNLATRPFSSIRSIPSTSISSHQFAPKNSLLTTATQPLPNLVYRLIVSHQNQKGKGFFQKVSKALSFLIKHLQFLSCGESEATPQLTKPSLNRLLKEYEQWCNPIRLLPYDHHINSIKMCSAWNMQDVPFFMERMGKVKKLVEMDMTKMFHNIPKNSLVLAVLWFFSTILFLPCKNKVTILPDGTCRWGSTVKHNAHIHTMISLLSFCLFAIHMDIFICLGTHIYGQMKGVPMGGSLSPAIAEIYCLWIELGNNTTTRVHIKILEWLKKAPPWVISLIKPLLPSSHNPSLAPTHTQTHSTFTLWPKIRYRDNILLFPNTTQVNEKELQKWLHQCYQLPFSTENVGTEMQCLGMQIRLNNCKITFGPKISTVTRFRRCLTKLDTRVTIGGMHGEMHRASIYSNTLQLWNEKVQSLLLEGLLLGLPSHTMLTVIAKGLAKFICRQHERT